MPKKSVSPYLSLRANGYWQYRRRIPLELQATWSGGNGRKTEFVVSLKTKDEREAKRRASGQEAIFTEKVRLKTQQLTVQRSENQKRIDAFYMHEYNLRERGIHPDQAPRVNAPSHVKQKYFDDREAYLYGKWDAKTQEVVGGLANAQLEHGIDHDGPNDLYQEIQQDIDFVTGISDRRSSIMSDVPTLEEAQEVYEQMLEAKGFAAAKKKRERRRVERLVEQLSLQLGAGNPDIGKSRTLDTIKQRDADLFEQQLGMNKAKSSVSREMTILSAMYNHALNKWSDTWPDHKRKQNPFSKRRAGLEKQHAEERRIGTAVNRKRRAFTPEELEVFLGEQFQRMNEQAQLVTLIAIHSGCRLEDASGLLLGDLFLQVNASDPIPFIYFRDNKLRAITKDGISREVPIFGELLKRLTKYTEKMSGSDSPLFPRYGLVDGSGAGNVSNVINTRIKKMRNGDVRLTAHSFRHTLQARFLAAKVHNQFAAYIGGWRDKDSVGLQAQYQGDGIPLELLQDALQKAHKTERWGRANLAAQWD